MTVDIRGTSTFNKGAQLMLEATVDRLGDRFKLSAAPALLDYEVRARLGMHQTLHVNRFPKLSGTLGSCVPGVVRERYGLIADREITGILDASGFAYSDSFGPERSRREAIFGAGWRRRGVPKVMLPQAFGPFQSEEVAKWTTLVLNQAEIVFARDKVSQRHLNGLKLQAPVDLAPDFTIGLAPLKVEMPIDSNFAAIVPNTKLITKQIVSEDEYTSFLVTMGRVAASNGLQPLLVVHESSDARLCATVAQQLGAPVFNDPHPRVLKGVIGGASLLVASRFHAIVGGLSQAVRTIAVGWSHKYGALLEDFDVPEWTGDLGTSPEILVNRVLTDDRGAARLREAKTMLTKRVDAMWDTTEQILESGQRT